MEYELYHYGVKGMKWGVRRAQKKAVIEQYRKEYRKQNSKKSALSRAYDRVTGADKIYAKTMYSLNNGKGPGSVSAKKPAASKPTTKKLTKKTINNAKKTVRKASNKKVEEITIADYPKALQFAKRWHENNQILAMSSLAVSLLHK